MVAAERGIWKAGEFNRMLRERGLVISAGKMSGWWSGNPTGIKFAEIDVLCATLNCTVADRLRGHSRYNAVAAVRSLFRLAERRGLVFTDPTRHLAGAGRGVTRTLLPMTDTEISTVRDAVTSPAQRLVVALAAAHAARGLTLDDVDLSGRTIVLTGHEQRLADLARATLLSWLRNRREHWPHIANRHVLLSRITALGTRPVSDDYLAGLLPDPVELDRIRQDRILHEALISGGDPLRLAVVFGIDHSTAVTYADLARG
jgi:hypothetical protein